MIIPGLVIFYGPKGRGVFTHFPIAAGKVVEVAPALDIVCTGLEDYVFSSPAPGTSRVALGYAMLYSHSFNPNMETQYGATSITFRAIRDIEAGEELTHSYGQEWWDLRGYEEIEE